MKMSVLQKKKDKHKEGKVNYIYQYKRPNLISSLINQSP